MKFNPPALCVFLLAVFFVFTGCASTKNTTTEKTISLGDKEYTVSALGSDVDSAPAPRGKRVDPVYPVEMKQAGIEGKVSLSFIVDQEGFTKDIKVVKSSNPAFDQPAIDAIQQTRFWPAIKDGQPISYRWHFPIIRFNLNPTSAPVANGTSGIQDVDSQPTPRGRGPNPVYPVEMRRAGIGGDIILSFTVDQEGFTRDIKVVSSSNHAFDQLAIDAIQQTRFWPAIKDGQPVSYQMQIPIAFRAGN